MTATVIIPEGGGIGGATILIPDDPTGAVVVIPADGVILESGSGGGHTIADEGTALAAQPILDFQGAGVTATDGGDRTVVTIPGGGAVDSVDGRAGTVTLGDLYDALGAAAAAQAAAEAASDPAGTADAKVSDAVYDATAWDGDTGHAPSKNAVRDKIESLSGGLAAVVDDTTPQLGGDLDPNGHTYPASGVAIADAGSNFTADEVESALTELALGKQAIGGFSASYGGLLAYGHSYTQYGPSSGRADVFANFTRRMAAALGLSADEAVLWGKGGAIAGSASDASDGDLLGTGSFFRHLFPGHAYSGQGGAPTRTSRAAPFLYVLMFGYNDAARQWAGNTTCGIRAYLNGMRSMIARARAREVHDSRDGTVGYSGFATTVSNERIQTGPSYRKSASNGDVLTVTVPSDFTGGTFRAYFLACTGLTTFLGSAIDNAVTTIPLATLGSAYLAVSNGDVIQIDNEQILVGAGGGTTSLTGCTRGYNGTTAAAHSNAAAVVLPTTTAHATVGGTAGATGTVYTAGQGNAQPSPAIRSRVPVLYTAVLTSAAAGKTITFTTAGIVGNEDVCFDSWSIDDDDPPQVLLINQWPAVGGFFTGSNVALFNGGLTTVAAEFDAAVQVVDVASYVQNRVEATLGTTMTTGTTSIDVTFTDAACLIGVGSVLKFVPSTEELLVTGMTGTGLTRTLTVTRGYNGTSATTHAIGDVVNDLRYVTGDRIHPSDLGHLTIAGKALERLETVARTSYEAAGSGTAIPRQPRLGDGTWLGRGEVTAIASPTIGHSYARPIYVPERTTLTRLQVYMDAAAAGTGLVRLGIYAPYNQHPGNLIYDLGQVATNTTGFVGIDCYVPLLPGWYFLTAVPQGSGATGTYRALGAPANDYPLQKWSGGLIIAPTIPKLTNYGSGTFTAGAGSTTTWAHGLSVTPRAGDFSWIYTSNPSGAPRDWVSAVDATNVTVTQTASIGGPTFDWNVDCRYRSGNGAGRPAGVKQTGHTGSMPLLWLEDANLVDVAETILVLASFSTPLRG